MNFKILFTVILAGALTACVSAPTPPKIRVIKKSSTTQPIKMVKFEKVIATETEAEENLIILEETQSTPKTQSVKNRESNSNKRFHNTKSSTPKAYSQTGKASYYANKFNGRRTANGEIFSNNKMTAAHRYLPMNTMLLVTNLQNGRQTVVRVNDRGPFIKGRIIDLSRAAAAKIGMIQTGVSSVKIEQLPSAN